MVISTNLSSLNDKHCIVKTINLIEYAYGGYFLLGLNLANMYPWHLFNLDTTTNKVVIVDTEMVNLVSECI